jgi:hypothetical protein
MLEVSMIKLASLFMAAAMVMPVMAQALPGPEEAPPQKKKVVKKKVVLKPTQPPPPAHP